MPIFEYVCKDCKKKFEAIVYGSQKAECPHCHGRKLEQQLSVFAVAGTGGKQEVSLPEGPGASCGMGGCCGGGCSDFDS